MSALTGRAAPDFSCKVVMPDGAIEDRFTFSKFAKGKYAAIVFYPKDFTFVCPSELIALDHRMEALRERNVAVLGVSVDSENAHVAWRNTPVDKGGIGPVSFPLASDIKHEISRAYGVENPDGVALRATFLIDREGIVRSQVVNDLPLGRDMDELLRTVDALQFAEEHGEVCPAGWKKGDPAMKETPESVARYLSEHGKQL